MMLSLELKDDDTEPGKQERKKNIISQGSMFKGPETGISRRNRKKASMLGVPRVRGSDKR